MADITMVPANVRPLEGARTTKAVAAEALTVGQVVYISTYSDGKPSVSKADASLTTTCHGTLGIVVAGPVTSFGSTTVASGATCDVLTDGPMDGFSGMTAGGKIWVSSATAGSMGTTVGTVSEFMGIALTPTTAWINILPVVVSA